jgi:hypothetical protein
MELTAKGTHICQVIAKLEALPKPLPAHPSSWLVDTVNGLTCLAPSDVQIGTLILLTKDRHKGRAVSAFSSALSARPKDLPLLQAHGSCLSGLFLHTRVQNSVLSLEQRRAEASKGGLARGPWNDHDRRSSGG